MVIARSADNFPRFSFTESPGQYGSYPGTPRRQPSEIGASDDVFNGTDVAGYTAGDQMDDILAMIGHSQEYEEMNPMFINQWHGRVKVCNLCVRLVTYLLI